MKRSLVTATVVLVLIAAQSGASAQSVREAPELLRATARAKERRMTALPSAIRQRNVELDVALLLEGSEPEDAEGSGPCTRPRRLTFTLFPDVVLHGTLAAIEPAYGDGRIASFSLEDDPDGAVVLSVVGEAVTGTIRTGGRLFQLHHVEGRVHTLSEVDEFRIPRCGTRNDPRNASVPGHTRDGEPSPSIELATAGQILDVLVVYTFDAGQLLGGTDGINSLINLAIFETNQGFAQSDVVMRVSLVHTSPVYIEEVGSMRDWVVDLRNDGDGVMDEVHELRDTYGADAVSLLTASGGEYLGTAYNIWTSLAADQAPNAFNVTQAAWATGDYVFAHELGHSLGCQHDASNTGGAALFPYAYGYRTPSWAYRSIMAYEPGTRLNLWSNPAKLAPSGEPMGEAYKAENWRVLNNVVGIASAWRASRGTGHQLTTTFSGGQTCGGNMFDLRPKDDITLTGIDIHTPAPVGTPVQARVWFRYGSYVGFEDTPAGWQVLADRTVASAGFGQPTRMDFASTITLDSGSTYGIFVAVTSSLACTYETYERPGRFENNDVLLVSGVSKSIGSFAGQTLREHIWNGSLYYRGSDGQLSLATTFAGGNPFARGCMFMVQAGHRRLSLNSLDLNISGTGPVTVDVWYRAGSYNGAVNNASAWKFVGTDFGAIAAGAGLPTRIAVGDIELLAGKTYSFYVNVSSRNFGQSLLCTDGTTSYSNLDLTIFSGIGRGYGAFSGGTFGPCILNGRFRYTLL